MANPHDALFKWTFSQPDRAADVLRTVLPAGLSARLDWSSLAQEPGSFVDKELASRHSDLLFRVTTLGGGSALLYVLFEHQSSEDPLMALRLLRYAVRAWDRWLADHADATRVPAVLPVVLFHGTDRWHAPTDLHAALDLDAATLGEARAHLPSLRFILEDLGHVSDDDLRRRAMASLPTLVLLALKHARGDVDQVIGQWLDLLQQVVHAPAGTDALAVVLRYIIQVSSRVSVVSLRETARALLDPRVEEAIVTAGQQLIEQGRQQGLQQGLQQGVQQGVQQGQRALLLTLLSARFGELPAWVTQRVDSGGSADVEQWARRLVSAAALQDVFA
ncbi:MAG: Rpn family recombination-promoting nuclease/putative transposase [Deltaproteobacteria bacterium]|nr:Rpn family recombination-promoting nuclease/putative transposase [Deltaproteobacteria bacterium]